MQGYNLRAVAEDYLTPWAAPGLLRNWRSGGPAITTFFLSPAMSTCPSRGSLRGHEHLAKGLRALTDWRYCLRFASAKKRTVAERLYQFKVWGRSKATERFVPGTWIAPTLLPTRACCPDVPFVRVQTLRSCSYQALTWAVGQLGSNVR